MDLEVRRFVPHFTYLCTLFVANEIDPTSNHGGAMGSFIILHASFTEYLIFYGSPLGSDGHSGRHLADDYFTILSGHEKRYLAGELEGTRYEPGQTNHLPRGTSSHYTLDGWALELAQGEFFSFFLLSTLVLADRYS